VDTLQIARRRRLTASARTPLVTKEAANGSA